MTIQNITVFGGSGFIGRYVVRRLAAQGAVVRVAVRQPAEALFTKTAGVVGQVTPLRATITNEAEVESAIQGADAVINLVGILYETSRQKFIDIHHHGAARVARLAKVGGVKRLLHLSALGADVASPSRYASSKGKGDLAVLQEFPNATILRPSVVFGADDNFFNLFASLAQVLPALPLIGGGKTKFQPVYVGDVAAAIVTALDRPDSMGKVYELGGPAIYTFRQLLEMILGEIQRPRYLMPLPFAVATAQASILQLLPKPLLTTDQVTLLRQHNVVREGALTLADLGLTATAVEAIVPQLLARYRPDGGRTK